MVAGVARATAVDAELFARGVAAEAIESGFAPGVAAALRVDGVWTTTAAGTFGLDDDRPITTSTPFRIASLSKPFAGILAGRRIAAGEIDPDEPVTRWMPELADLRVLREPAGGLGDTVPAEHPVTLRQLLTLTVGSGSGFDDTPIQRELQAFATGPIPPQLDPDSFLVRFASLPLEHQPGTHWGYHVGSELLSVLLARVTDLPLPELVRREITEPLGMDATAFWTEQPLPRQYRPTADGGLEPWDEYGDLFAAPPPFPGLGGGLVSTLDDLTRFWSAFSDGELLPPELHTAMTTPQLDVRQHEGMAGFGGEGSSWGWQIGITTGDDDPFVSDGSYGWAGGSGTTAAADPARGIVGIALSQRFLGGPGDDFGWFWRPALAALR